MMGCILLDGGSGSALAAQASSAALVSVSPTGAALAGVNAGAGIISFAKKGSEILSGYPFFYSSDNGASFASQAVDIPSASLYSKVATDTVKWAAIKGDNVSGGSVYRSTNRANWTGATLTSNTITYWIAYGDGVWAITGTDSTTSQGAIWYGSDLISFTKSNGGLSGGFSGGQLAYGNGYFLTAGAGGGTIERASSGAMGSWSRITLSGSQTGMTNIAYSTVNSRWVVGGVAGGLYKFQYSNDNGATWTVATVPSPTLTMGGIKEIKALPGGGFIAVGVTAGSLGAAIYSTDGTAWDNIPDAEDFQGLYGLVAL